MLERVKSKIRQKMFNFKRGYCVNIPKIKFVRKPVVIHFPDPDFRLVTPKYEIKVGPAVWQNIKLWGTMYPSTYGEKNTDPSFIVSGKFLVLGFYYHLFLRFSGRNGDFYRYLTAALQVTDHYWYATAELKPFRVLTVKRGLDCVRYYNRVLTWKRKGMRYV